MENKKKKEVPQWASETITGIIVVALIIFGIFVVYQAFFGWIWFKWIFWSIVGIFAIIGAFRLIGKLVIWISEEFF